MTQNSQVRVRILSFPELWSNETDEAGEVIFDAECRIKEFAAALHSTAQKLLEVYGEAGYLGKWAEHPFPIEELRRLDTLQKLST